MWTLIAAVALRRPRFPTSVYTATDCCQLPYVTQEKYNVSSSSQVLISLLTRRWQWSPSSSLSFCPPASFCPATASGGTLHFTWNCFMPNFAIYFKSVCCKVCNGVWGLQWREPAAETVATPGPCIKFDWVSLITTGSTLCFARMSFIMKKSFQ